MCHFHAGKCMFSDIICIFRTGLSLRREPVLYRHPGKRRRSSLDGRRAELGAERVARSTDRKAAAMDPEDDRDWAVHILGRVDDELDAFGRRLDRRGPVLRRDASRGAGVELHHAPPRLRAFGPGELGDAVEFIEAHGQPHHILEAFVDEL